MQTTAHPAGFAREWRVPDPAEMTPEQLAGQMVQIQVPGRACTPETAAFLARYRVGSVILFSGNVATPAQAAAFTRGLQEAAAAAGLPPLLLAIDQEGGAASVVQQGVSHPPFLMGIGATGDARSAAAAGRVLAREVRAMGFHWLFAPVLDVNCNPANPVIGPRSFGSDPDLVGRMGAAFVRAVQAEGVLACGKHFPGHGDTSLDSHLDLPSLPHGRERLEAVELKPFRMAIEAGLGSLMTAHVVFPAIEPEGVPATLSRRVLTDLLRDEMGYDGLLITDSMVMNAIKEHYGTAEAAVRAVLAGADMVMALGDLDRAATTLEALAAAIAHGTIPRERAEASVRRVLAAKDRFLRPRPPAGDAAQPGAGAEPHRNAAGWVQPGDVAVCDSPEHRAVVADLCLAAVRPVCGELPRLKPGERVLVLAPERVERPMSLDFSAPLADLVEALRSCGVRADGRDTGMDPDPQRAAALVRGAAAYDAVLVCCTEKAELPGGIRMLADRLAGHPGRILVSLGSPYPVAGYPVAVCSHGRFRPSCEALARALTGVGAP
ncbi:beta-N-acetylhexosaminidase [Symbiobacterium terraclitae]|uniref:Beta-N-acetylhexosaminidase n=1 Tax=Symbiobacterium terraclitae TaxID=557451 RepID=A0ABS4JYT8_9FIRM|nr:glycoside hydrolase family 3 protein [Symbiobacterium terraclitae]MBP2019609.1 beta-N-acetylhexosaminidase [Symbiobacterium terraclitae]